jgi:hypothetical protein
MELPSLQSLKEFAHFFIIYFISREKLNSEKEKSREGDHERDSSSEFEGEEMSSEREDEREATNKTDLKRKLDEDESDEVREFAIRENDSKKDISQEHEDRERSRERSPDRSYEKKGNDQTPLKNGCCRACMRAWSKSGRACPCQVPASVRRFPLPPEGCKYFFTFAFIFSFLCSRICHCHGCNPSDLRGEILPYELISPLPF